MTALLKLCSSLKLPLNEKVYVLFQVNGTAVTTLSQAETEDLLSSNILVLEVQNSISSPRFIPLESLLDEVDDKIIRDSTIRQKAEFKEAKLADSLSALQGSEKIGASDLSSALQSELDDDNSSIFVPNTALNMSPSLTPLYEDKERTRGTQTNTGTVCTCIDLTHKS